jgi:hypothetical protein
MTNDDVGMAMRAHGFGGFATGTPFLQWGNIVWGIFVHNMPSAFGIHGYSIATYLVLFFISYASLLVFSQERLIKEYVLLITAFFCIFFHFFP